MAEKSLKRQAMHGIAWKMAETVGRQGVQFIVSVILARLIMPAQFGAIAMLSIFLAISNTLIDSGFSTALIRKTDRTQADCSTVFWFNLVISVVMYVILFVCAPWVSDFYDMPILTKVLRVTSLSLIIAGLTSVHNTLFAARMDFKTMAKFHIISTIISGIVGVTMAYHNFQIWALVAQQLTASACNSMFVWFKSPWRPTFEFSVQSFKEFFGFGSKILASSLLDTTYNNIYGIVIGKVYKAADLAFYNRGYSLMKFSATIPTKILQSVTYPTLCKIQDNDDKLRDGYRRTLRIASFVIFPLCLGLGAVSYPLINIVYTAKWMFAAKLLEIIVFGSMWYPVHAINLNLLMVKGRSDLFFRLEVIKKVVGVTILCITVPLGIVAMCYGNIASSLIALGINTFYTGKLINMGFLQQLRDYAPFLTLSISMYVVGKIVTTTLGDGWVSLVTGITICVLIYAGGAILFKFQELTELKSMIWKR